MKESVCAVMAVGMFAFALASIGCESTPIRAFRGARHYAAGTEALERSDGAQAIAELEQAADLVPHASEIQNHLGLAYWSDGRTQAARGAFERAIELDCENVVARVNLERLMRSGDVVGEAAAGGDSAGGSVGGSVVGDVAGNIVGNVGVDANVEEANGVDANGG